MANTREPILEPVPILSLRPTQMTVGMREVKEKRKRWRDHKSKKKQEELLGKHMIPVVLGPDGKYYVVDHHHLARALHDEGVKDILVTVIGDLTMVQRDAFWGVMDNKRWAYPYDANRHRDQLGLRGHRVQLRRQAELATMNHIDRGGARALDRRIHIVGGGAVRCGFDFWLKPHHVQPDGIHGRIAELDLGAELAGRRRRRGIEALQCFAQRKHERRLFGRRRAVGRRVALAFLDDTAVSFKTMFPRTLYRGLILSSCASSVSENMMHPLPVDGAIHGVLVQGCIEHRVCTTLRVHRSIWTI